MTAEPVRQHVGIRDWDAKKALLKQIYCTPTDKAFFGALIKECHKAAPERSPRLDAVLDAQRKWVASRPIKTEYLALWDFIVRDLGLQCNGAQLITSTFERFIDLLGTQVLPEYAAVLIDDPSAPLSEAQRDKLRAVIAGAPAAASAANDGEYSVLCDLNTHHEGPLSALKDGRWSVSRFYNAPEAARAWFRLVDSRNYRMYMDCVSSLEVLVATPEWNRALLGRRYNATVSLAGGGSPEKDLVLARSILRVLDDGREVEYRLVDMSLFMIQESLRLLLPRRDLQRIRLTAKVANILELEKELSRPAHWDSVVWALLGGTIGNLPERDFFRSLRGPSRSGDLLVIGLDTHDGESWANFEERMTKQYKCTELDALLQAQPLGIGQEDGPIVEVGVRQRDDGDQEHNVRGSWIAEFKYRSDGRRRVMGSTRYTLKEFLAFAQDIGGWAHLATTPATDSTFRQLLLRRI